MKENSALSHCMIGKNRIWGGSGQGLFAVSFEGAGDIGSANASGLMDYEYGLEAESSLWFSDEQEQGILASWNQEKRKVAIYYLSGREQETAEADDRETITLSGFFISEQIQKAVLEFNQSNDLYRIEVLDEDERVEIVDLATRLDTQLMAGKGADLLAVNTWTWFRDYVENGFLEDLAPYIEREGKQADRAGDGGH